jgi:hypothetical protein
LVFCLHLLIQTLLCIKTLLCVSLTLYDCRFATKRNSFHLIKTHTTVAYKPTSPADIPFRVFMEQLHYCRCAALAYLLVAAANLFCFEPVYAFYCFVSFFILCRRGSWQPARRSVGVFQCKPPESHDASYLLMRCIY